MRKITYIIAILSFTIFSCKSNKNTVNHTNNGNAVAFEFEKSKTLMAVLDKAKEENKLVFVDFYASWCMPCKMMDEDVFTNKELGHIYNKNFINYKINVEESNGANIAALYEIKYYPTLMFLDSSGNVVVKHEAAAYYSKMKELADEALAIGHP